MSWTAVATISACLFVALSPQLVAAQVVINEIMYNPQGSDADSEWIELYNAGSSDVTMTGGSGKGSWRIADSSNHTLTDPSSGTGRGSLVVPAGGYLVIASDPSTFIGEYPGGSYSIVKSSISLSNAGATISLLDGSGTVVDSVSYSSAQGGADDGTSLQKETDGSWIAALPTPGAMNATVAYTPPPAQSTSTNPASQTQNSTPSTSVSSYVPPPLPEAFADAGGDRTVIVGADTEFDGNAYDRDQNELDPSTTRFSWNFGDGATAEGAAVLHHWEYPGRYAVVLSIAEDKYAAADTITVTAEPAALGFAVEDDGSVSIQNNSGHDLDLSRWIVRESGGAFAGLFMLPEHSTILAGEAMRIGSATLGFRAGKDSALEYPNGVPVALSTASASTTSVQEEKPPQAAASAPAPAQRVPSAPIAAISASAPMPTKAAPKASVSDEPTSSAVPENADPPTTDVASSEALLIAASSSQVAAVGAIFSGGPWWLAALALIVLGSSALVFARRSAKHEWNIEETL